MLLLFCRFSTQTVEPRCCLLQIHQAGQIPLSRRNSESQEMIVRQGRTLTNRLVYPMCPHLQRNLRFSSGMIANRVWYTMVCTLTGAKAEKGSLILASTFPVMPQGSKTEILPLDLRNSIGMGSAPKKIPTLGYMLRTVSEARLTKSTSFFPSRSR